MANRYCTNCGAELLEEARFCGSCGSPAHQTAAVATPEADVKVPAPPPRRNFWDEDQPGGRGIRGTVRAAGPGKIAGLILAVVVGVPVLLAVMWIVLQFVLGFILGFFSELHRGAMKTLLCRYHTLRDAGVGRIASVRAA